MFVATFYHLVVCEWILGLFFVSQFRQSVPEFAFRGVLLLFHRKGVPISNVQVVVPDLVFFNEMSFDPGQNPKKNMQCYSTSYNMHFAKTL